jgi:Type IX secretion system protein PorV
MKLIIAVLVAGLLVPASVCAQNNNSKTGTSAATFLEIPVGARGIGMGDAFVSLSNDVTALYWNAAGTARFEQSEASVSHTSWIAGTKFDFAGLVLPLGTIGTIGVSYIQLAMDDMKVRTVEQPEGTGEYFSAGDMAIGLSYARQLSDRFSIGFTAKYIQQTIWHETASAMAVDIGTIFRTDLLGGLTIGASLSNFGTSMKLAGRDARKFISMDATKLGSNAQIPADVEFDSWNLPLLFQFGISTIPWKSDDFAWTVAVDALHPSDDYETVNIGTELAYRNFFFVRGGFSSFVRRGSSPPWLDGNEGGLCLGVGLTSDLFSTQDIRARFDYAYRNMGLLENIQVITLAVQF